MFLKNEDVKIGTIPDANGSDNPLKKMEFLTEKEMKDSSRLFGKSHRTTWFCSCISHS